MVFSGAVCGVTPVAASQPPPIIDVHFHAPDIGADDSTERQRVLQSMQKNNIVSTVLYLNEPSDVEQWKLPRGRFIASVPMPCFLNRGTGYYCFSETGGWPDRRWLEGELASGRVRALGEMLFNYAGVGPNDRRMRPYWALAAKYGTPVFVHTGRGPGPDKGPRRNPNCCPQYNAALGNPALLRPVLKRFPRLRIALLHFGAGDPVKAPYFRDEALALLRDYPSVYVDMTVISSVAPGEVYAAELRGLIDAGFGDRIMFGTDNHPPEPIIARLAAMKWLSDRQRRDILYNNAARFLRLTK